MTTPLPPLPPSTMGMMLRSSLMGRKTHRQLRARQGTMRQHRTRPSSLSRHGLLLTMEPAGTPLLKTYTALDPVILGEHMQVISLTCCPIAAGRLGKFSVCWAAACLLYYLHSCLCMLCLLSVTYMATTLLAHLPVHAFSIGSSASGHQKIMGRATARASPFQD